MFSKEHYLYLKKLKKERILIRFFQVMIIVIFIVGWQILADTGIINTFIASSPKKVIETIISLHKTGDLYHHIFVTLYETLFSFGLGTILGFLIATLLWWNKFLSKVIDPYLTIINSLPKVALGPIIIIWGGAGIKSIIIMALLISTIITIINVTDGFNSAPVNQIKLLKTFNATKLQTFYKLILPHSFKIIISALKINISMSLIGVIMGEFLVSKEGIGYLIVYGSQTFNLNLVITGTIVLAILSAFMYYSILYIEKKLNHQH